MKALVKRSKNPHDVAVLEIPEPVAAAGQLVVRTEACGICGSDVHAWKQDQGYEWVRPPVVIGHEAVGRVIAVGAGVDSSWVGKRIIPLSIDGCAECALCLAGMRQLCAKRDVFGLSWNGAAAEQFALPVERLILAPDDVPAMILAMAEPLSVAYHAVSHLAHLPVRETRVAVSGPGPIGLMCAMLLDRLGYQVVLIGAPRDLPTRLPFAASLGLTTIVSGEELPFQPDAWVDASGAGAALAAGCQAIVSNGIVVVVGLFGTPAGLDLNIVVRKQLRIQGSYGSVAADYRAVVDILAEAPARWAKLVREMPLDAGVTALEQTANAEVVKAVLVLD
jgi:L-iditol 2-dehydrogenase